jgi:serine/threonine protein phosphatase 1
MATKKMTFVIGDVLGMARHLEVLSNALIEYAARASAQPRMVFLGNLIGGGPQSNMVLEKCFAITKTLPGSLLVMGERDFLLLRLLEGKMTRSEFNSFAMLGGPKILHSYGVRDLDGLEARRSDILSRYPSHIELLRNAKKYDIEGDYCFTHCGIRLGVPLVNQTAKDMRSSNGDFLHHSQQHEKILVHGHVSREDCSPAVFPNRISLNTNVDFSGNLTSLVIEDECATHFAIASSLDRENANSPIIVSFSSVDGYRWNYGAGVATAA